MLFCRRSEILVLNHVPSPQPSEFSRADGWALGSLVAVYVILHGAIAMGIPAFEPAVHNDDWVNALVVKQLCEEERFQLHRLTGALALPQIIAGWAWCQAVGGFSFTALRTLMVLHGLLPVWLLWWFLRRLNAGRAAAMLSTLLFCVNPITVSLTWSFQTDMVYLSFILGAMLATLRTNRGAALRACGADAFPHGERAASDETQEAHEHRAGRCPKDVQLASASVIDPCFVRAKKIVSSFEARFVLVAAGLLWLAFLTRQNAIFVTAGVAAYWGLRRHWLWLTCTLALIPLMMFAEKWLTGQSELTYLPWVKGQLIRSLGNWPVGRIVFCTYETLHLVMFLGLLLLPMLVAAAPELMRTKHVAAPLRDAELGFGETERQGTGMSCLSARVSVGRCMWLLAALALVTGVLLIDIPSQRPVLLGNYIYVGERCGVGPATLEISNANPAGVARGGQHPILISLISVAGLIGGTLMLVVLGDATKRFARAIRFCSCGPRFLADVAFWASLAGTLAASVLIGRTPFDRYVLLLCPLAMPLCIRADVPLRRLLAIVVPVTVLLAVVSYVGVVDYWHWNHARWQALSWLDSQGVGPERIDGGYEFNAIHNTLALPPEIMTKKDWQQHAAILDASRARETYTLRFTVQPQDHVAARFGYQTHLRADTQYIHIVQNRENDARDARPQGNHRKTGE